MISQDAVASSPAQTPELSFMLRNKMCTHTNMHTYLPTYFGTCTDTPTEACTHTHTRQVDERTRKTKIERYNN